MPVLKSNPGFRIGWLIPLRLSSFSIVSLVIFIWLGYPSYLRLPFLVYCLFALGALLLILFNRRRRFPVLFQLFIFGHFGAEIFCDAGIVYSTGSLYSPFSALFLLTIVSAGLVYRLAGTLLVATIVSLSYIYVTWLNAAFHLGGSLIRPDFSIISNDDLYFYSAFLHILIFYLVAFIAGYLAQKLQSTDTELQNASVELKKARLETGDILRHLNSGLLTVDREGRIAFFNRAAENILGITQEEIAGRSCRDVFTGRLSAMGENLMSVFESSRRLSRSEIDIETGDGETVPIGISTSVLIDEDSSIRGLIAIFQDISDAKKLEERIRYADRLAAIGELSAYIAHEIRNPLASISGSVEILKKDLQLDGDYDRLLSLIIKESSRLNKILTDFLNYARIGRTQFRRVEINRIILDTLELVRQHPSYHKAITLDLQTERHLEYVSGDEDQLKQLLLNLAVNSCDAIGPEKGFIQFVVEPVREDSGPDKVRIIIRDSGPGVDPEMRDKVFMPFFSTKKTGTGLGLAIVSRLVEEHQGTVEVYSSPGKGCEFHLYFLGINSRPRAVAATVTSLQNIS